MSSQILSYVLDIWKMAYDFARAQSVAETFSFTLCFSHVGNSHMHAFSSTLPPPPPH